MGVHADDSGSSTPRSSNLKTGTSSVVLRPAVPSDAEALLALYRPIVLETAISFEIDPPSVEEFRQRIETTTARWAWLVAEHDSEPVAYAYASAHRTRAAYRWSVETSICVGSAHRGRGLGTMLYEELLRTIADLGYCNAYAAIALPNDASIALHRRVGFEHIGVFRNVGRKFGRWHDVSWWQRKLRDEPPGDRSG
jgi:phosphinothricin acetyltransferase